MAPFRKRPLRARYTPRKPAKRTKIYGREISTTIRSTSEAIIKTGQKTTAYGWTYGKTFKLKFGDIKNSLPQDVREFKVHRVTYSVTALMVPAPNVITPYNNGTTKYWPSSLNLAPDHKFYVACVLQDGDGGDGDTHKFKTISDLKSYCLPGKFKFGNTKSQLSFTGVWTPQEPSEQEWLGSKDHLSTLLSLYVYSQTMGTEWYNPDSTNNVERSIQVYVDFTIHAVYRGKISTQTSKMIIRQSGDEDRPQSVNLDGFEDLCIPQSPTTSV